MATSGCFDGKKEKNCFVWPERKAGGECRTPWWAACCQNWRKFHRIRSQGWIMEIGKSLEKKLTCKRDFSNILHTVLSLMLKDPFKQSVRTRWRSGIHCGGLVGFRFRPLFKLEEYQINGHHHCQQEFKGKTSGKLFSVLTSDLSSKKDFPPHICEPIYFSKIPPSPRPLSVPFLIRTSGISQPSRLG